jgi:hypothetical protein
MTHTAKVLRHVAFTLMAVFGLLGGMFVAGETFADPGVWSAVAMTAAWALPLIALSVFALRRSAAAGPVFVGATALIVLFILADSAFGIIPRDTGPVVAVVLFAIGVALAFLGLHRAELAGLLMLVVGLAELAANWGRLGGSSGVVILPILLVGLLFLLAGALGNESLRSRSAHASCPRQLVDRINECDVANVAPPRLQLHVKVVRAQRGSRLFPGERRRTSSHPPLPRTPSVAGTYPYRGSRRSTRHDWSSLGRRKFVM